MGMESVDQLWNEKDLNVFLFGVRIGSFLYHG